MIAWIGRWRQRGEGMKGGWWVLHYLIGDDGFMSMHYQNLLRVLHMQIYNYVRWHRSVIPALDRWKQVDQKFKTTSGT